MEERVRALTPWVLLPRFNNVVLTVSIARGGLLAVPRNVELYVTRDARVFIPSAASMLYPYRLRFEYEYDASRKTVRVRGVDGLLVGYLPDGERAAYSARTLYEKIGEIEMRAEGRPSTIDVEDAAASAYRMEAGRLFAYRVGRLLAKAGFAVAPLGVVTIKRIVLRGVYGRVEAEYPVKVRLYSVHARGEHFTATGLVPAALALIQDRLLRPEGVDEAEEKVRDWASVGRRVYPISGGILKHTSRATFTYYVGDVEAKERQRGRRWLWGGRAARGTHIDFYIDGDKLLMAVTMRPFSPPATIVMNFPPFNLAPLAAVLRERREWIEYNLGRASKRAREMGAKIYSYIGELEVLSDAGVTIEDARRPLKEGYPRPATLDALAEKIEKLGEIADLVSMTVGDVYKIEKLLIEAASGNEKQELLA